MKTNYYDAKSVACGWKARVYTYDATGNREVVIWQSETVYRDKGEAEDAACEWAEDNNVEVELG